MSKNKQLRLMIHPLHNREFVKKQGGWASYYQYLIEHNMARMDKQGNVKMIMPTIEKVKKIGRNSSCPCGSGKKYKKCCLFGLTNEDKEK